ncbi:S49 family peptidase [Candidatus Puniceispirillum marinum]|jgi:serine protease SohB|uniref:Peptidase S49 n=1 Tax=Puniceispirillum marinum (strain IMCC1322) TaxID=488538 RepID=D5BPL4_PUNMI|nr:S49 family peptidase [Candidatus Puniceispirillum marinum]ADE40516.1 peptidase S49 [Candidatus Puniceispirillum marinum IMCC1322]
MGVFNRIFFWRKKKPVVPVVRLGGVIAASGSGMRRGISLETVEPQLKKAFSIKRAKAVALIINSPGGSPVQSSLIGRRIRDLAKRADVPVLAFCEDVAASGGYWLAASADEIYADPASIIGSIGVVSAGFGFDKAIKKIGVDRRVHTAGESKMILDPFQPEQSEEVERLKALQAEIHTQFIAHIENRRGAKLKGDRAELFSGAFWTGETAVKLGLVDAVGEIRQTINSRFGDDTELMMIEPKRKLLPFGLTNLSGQMASGIVNEASDIAIERVYLSRFGL